MKQQAFYSSAGALGDLICATPTIKKLSEIFQSQITVISHQPALFKNLPYVKESLNITDKSESEFENYYDLHKTFFLTGKRDSYGVEFKHSMCDIRQYHAKDLGFLLTPDELTCDFIPSEPKEYISKFNLPEKYVVIHPAKSWDSRTWSQQNWQALCDGLAELNIPVVSIGKDAKEESQYYTYSDKPLFELSLKKGINLTNKTSLDETWHILNNAQCLITMDSGVMHLAGTTDTHIIQLGSSIKPEYRAPWRKSSQDYKYSYILGSCNRHCASDLKYSIRDWGNIQSVTLIRSCLENKPTFECNPSFGAVLETVKKVFESTINNSLSFSKPQEQRYLVEVESDSLGDTIAAFAVIDKWSKIDNKKVSVLSNHSSIFRESYPNLNIFDKKSNTFSYIPNENLWLINSIKHTHKINTNYKFQKPLLNGFAQDFNISVTDVRPKVDSPKMQRPLKGKYVCIGFHSTCQAKYWNYPNAWNEICKYLRSKNLTPVVVEKHESFGIKGNFNWVPDRAVKRIGLPFDEVLNYIDHCEFFMGLSSGLTWVAQGLGKPTVIISNFTSKENEFVDDKTLRIYDETVCHGCFHKHSFNPDDWLWCPVYRNDEQNRFICTKVITPQTVINKMEQFFNL